MTPKSNPSRDDLVEDDKTQDIYERISEHQDEDKEEIKKEVEMLESFKEKEKPK